jgi:hypothetical protein
MLHPEYYLSQVVIQLNILQGPEIKLARSVIVLVVAFNVSRCPVSGLAATIVGIGLNLLLKCGYVGSNGQVSEPKNYEVVARVLAVLFCF